MTTQIDTYRSTDATDEGTFVGKGFKFPVTVDSTGEIQKASGNEHIEGCIFRNCLYNKGDLVGTYPFGGGLSGAIFSVFSNETKSELRQSIIDSITAFEPRVSNINIVFERKGDSDAEFICTVVYSIKQTNEFYSASFTVGD